MKSELEETVAPRSTPRSENWNPGHSVNKGWPYDGVFSQQMFRNRLNIWHDKSGEIGIDINEKTWGNVEVAEKRTPFESFLMLRLYDYAVALKLAEDQIQELLSETPFNPEDIGFELVVRHPEGEAPMKIYVSIYNPDFSIFRKPGGPMDPDWNPTSWTVLLGKEVDGHKIFQEIDLNLPCARIAYAAFAALGLKMWDEMTTTYQPSKEAPEAVNQLAVDTIKNIQNPKTKTFKLNFKRGEIDQDFDVEVDKRDNEKDAIGKLMFLLESGATHLGSIEAPKFEEISVIPSQQSKRQRKSPSTEPPSAENSSPATQ